MVHCQVTVVPVSAGAKLHLPSTNATSGANGPLMSVSVAERPRRVDTGQLLAHAPAADHRDDTGLSDRIPSTRLIPDLLDWWDQAVPVRTNHRQRCRQRATERILGLHRNRSRLLDDDRLCHWITRPILDIPAGDAASNSSVPARERPGR